MKCQQGLSKVWLLQSTGSNGTQGLRSCGKGIDYLVNCHHTQSACWIYFNKQMLVLMKTHHLPQTANLLGH